MLEVSTPEIGTTYRLEDDYARPDETEAVRTAPGDAEALDPTSRPTASRLGRLVGAVVPADGRRLTHSLGRASGCHPVIRADSTALHRQP